MINGTSIRKLLWGKLKRETTHDKYKNKIIYKNFSEIEFEQLPKEKVNILHDLEMKLYNPYIKDKKTFEKIILEEAAKLGYTREAISMLPIKDAIELSVDIVTSKMEYRLVDQEEEFIKTYGKHLPIDKYFMIGQGDCDKYASAVTAVLKIIKDFNDNLKNVYISNLDCQLGGFSLPHDWNSIIFLIKDKIILTHIDPTFADGGGNLEAKRGYHVPENDTELLARFYMDISDYGSSFDYYTKLLSEGIKPKKRAEVLSGMAFLACMLHDSKKMQDVREQFIELDTKEYLDRILYYSYLLEKDKMHFAKAKFYKNELIEKCPGSYWVGQVAKNSG